MNCHEWEERIALHATGDAPDSSEVERHIAQCSGCALFLSGLRQNLEWLQAVHREEIAPVHFAVVRARVRSELEKGGAAWWRQGWVYGLAAAVLIAAFVVGRPHNAAIHTSTATVRTESVIVPDKQVEMAVRREPPRKTRGDQGVARRPGGLPHNAETLLVKLETDNPDVVIYWLAEKRGD